MLSSAIGETSLAQEQAGADIRWNERRGFTMGGGDCKLSKLSSSGFADNSAKG